MADFLSETVETKRQCNDIQNSLKKKNKKSQWIYQYSAKLSFRNKDEIKTCLDEWKPRYFSGSLFFQEY